MKAAILPDISLNCIVPILFGCWFYAGGNYFISGSFMSGYLTDWLWAYAFLSSILIVWDRRVSYHWIAVCCCVAFLFEWLQYQKLVAGTGDLFDILVYHSGFAVALFLNNCFRSKFNIK